MSSCGESMLSRSIRGAATITSPAVRSAMRITPSSITRDSAPMMSLSSASARVSISSALESGPGMDELGDLLQESALVFLFEGSARRVRVGHSLGVQDVR